MTLVYKYDFISLCGVSKNNINIDVHQLFTEIFQILLLTLKKYCYPDSNNN